MKLVVFREFVSLHIILFRLVSVSVWQLQLALQRIKQKFSKQSNSLVQVFAMFVHLYIGMCNL